MDDAAIMLLMLLFLAIILAAIILPIVALVISIRPRKKIAILPWPTSPVGSPGQTSTSAAVPLEESIRQLEARIVRLEATLKTGQAVIPRPVTSAELSLPIADSTPR